MHYDHVLKKLILTSWSGGGGGEVKVGRGSVGTLFAAMLLHVSVHLI